MSLHKRAAYLNTTQFTWNSATKTLTADASEIEMGFCLFDTLNIKSDATGKLVTFDLSTINRNPEFEITAWVYTSKQSPVKVIVFND